VDNFITASGILTKKLDNLGADIAKIDPDISEFKRKLDNVKPEKPIWQDDDCHRSALSSHALAAKKIESNDPKTSVTFLHLACSGGIIKDVINQIAEAKKLLGDREIDAVLLSVGGNDVGFSSIVTLCVTREPCHIEPNTGVSTAEDLCVILYHPLKHPTKEYSDCVKDLNFLNLPTKNADKLFKNKLWGEGCTSQGDPDSGCRKLLDSYRKLQKDHITTLEGLYPSSQRDISDPDPILQNTNRIYHIEYVDASKNQNGVYCNNDPPSISEGEWKFFDMTVTRILNSAVKDADTENGWTNVDGIYSGFSTHGLCSNERWLVLLDTFDIQGDRSGMAHPNIPGHEFTGEKIFEKLVSDFYPGGEPRKPDPMPDVTIQVEPDDGVTITVEPTLPDDELKVTELSIPDWIKNTAGWWAERSVDDSDFTGGISYLIEEGIISIPDLPAATVAVEENVPDWVRNMAGWWADNLTTDQEFADAIKFLVEKGIIQVQT